MHVLIVSNLFPPEVIGGAEKHAKSDAEYLVDRGHKVSVITTGVDGPIHGFSWKEREGVDVYRTKPLNMYSPFEHQDKLGWKKPIQHIIDQWNPQTYTLVRQHINDLDPDIIHVHNYSGLSKSVFSASAVVECPVIHTLHDYNSLHIRPSLFSNGEIITPGRLMGVYQKYNDLLIGSNIDKVIAPSQFIIDKHHEQGVFDGISSECVPLGIETTGIKHYDGGADDQDGTRLLFAGQLTYSKGVDILIDAVKQLDGSDLELHILGKGPYREVLEEQVEGDGRIKFHGFVSEQELARQYTNADYTVVPSRWYDNSPMVIYESYARHTPVIGANIGGIPELIEKGETGFCFEPEQPDDLADVIEDNKNKSDMLAENLADVDVSLDTHVDRLIEVYESLIHQSARAVN
ncbi:glycosyltransferase family 4 protein [Halomicrobium salinisoli]|uniref:glycosyltransferase family 4 protein n=1 Tax=Halomicrobium salinisoli TaxID=2878391 RepID=UPI001CEFB9B0|nr:glycosyltransferase family 4 protein [Halomicrobium salinisoli]